jgi:hypothetical protein
MIGLLHRAEGDGRVTIVGAWRPMFLLLGLAVQASVISHVRLQAGFSAGFSYRHNL